MKNPPALAPIVGTCAGGLTRRKRLLLDANVLANDYQVVGRADTRLLETGHQQEPARGLLPEFLFELQVLLRILGRAVDMVDAVHQPVVTTCSRPQIHGLSGERRLLHGTALLDGCRCTAVARTRQVVKHCVVGMSLRCMAGQDDRAATVAARVCEVTTLEDATEAIVPWGVNRLLAAGRHLIHWRIDVHRRDVQLLHRTRRDGQLLSWRARRRSRARRWR